MIKIYVEFFVYHFVDVALVLSIDRHVISESIKQIIDDKIIFVLSSRLDIVLDNFFHNDFDFL